MTVKKSRYLRLSAARRVRSETSGRIPQTNSRIGAEEITCSASTKWRFPSRSLNLTVHVDVVSSKAQPLTRAAISILPPIAFTFSAHASHIMPGPLRGYRNELIKVLMTLVRSPFEERCGKSAFLIALPSDRPRIRCAAQSAEISLQLIPHTFSV